MGESSRDLWELARSHGPVLSQWNPASFAHFEVPAPQVGGGVLSGTRIGYGVSASTGSAISSAGALASRSRGTAPMRGPGICGTSPMHSRRAVRIAISGFGARPPSDIGPHPSGQLSFSLNIGLPIGRFWRNPAVWAFLMSMSLRIATCSGSVLHPMVTINVCLACFGVLRCSASILFPLSRRGQWSGGITKDSYGPR